MVSENKYTVQVFCKSKGASCKISKHRGYLYTVLILLQLREDFRVIEQLKSSDLKDLLVQCGQGVHNAVNNIKANRVF